MAYRLVVEGLKLQTCSPGFVDGRNAILKADNILYGGVHSCLIWNCFCQTDWDLVQTREVVQDATTGQLLLICLQAVILCRTQNCFLLFLADYNWTYWLQAHEKLNHSKLEIGPVLSE